jgi:hypothetical protein
MENEEVKITEKDVIDMMDLFTKVPSLLLKGAVSSNLNVVKSFEGQIESYKNKLSDLELLKIEKVMEMPVPELQEILMKAYNETKKKQLKILADPGAEPFIKSNLNELEKVLSNNKE